MKVTRMIARIIIGILFCIATGTASAYPPQLDGTWEESFNGDAGPISVSIQHFNGVTAVGVIHVRNSAHCLAPVPFRGQLVDGKRMQIESSADIVCGYSGKLTGEVVNEGDALYTGSFQYKYLRITWGRGTFRMKATDTKVK